MLSGTFWRLGGLALAALVVGTMTWWLLSRIDKSYEADDLEKKLHQAERIAELREAQKHLSDQLRLKAQEDLDGLKAEFKGRLAEAKKYVAIIPPKDPKCGLGPELTRMLNKVRGYPGDEVPAAAGRSP